MLLLPALRAEIIPVSAAPSSGRVGRLAASELASHLARIYPGHQFPVADKAPASGRAISLSTARLSNSEAFRVSPGRIVAGSTRGLLCAVYALLEKLGYGFYLSYEAAPEPRRGAFTFDQWHLEDTPLYSDRVVFDWHNFLSSCSTWELEDWQRWIAQSAKMRYNAVMVHAYGNNPMFQFTYNGQTKPVGYLATTAMGRDWGTQHVNDVRRIVGGELFQQPVFAGSAALVAGGQRAAASTRLMQQVFTYARERGMGVTYAHDVDTESANPQNIINTLPASARLTDGQYQLANPETPEGYDYWKSQVRQLLETYPQIDRLVVWFRNDRTPWRNLTPDRFPESWKREFEAALAKRPALKADKESHGMFAIAKIVVAFQKILRDLKRNDVELAAGTWRFYYVPAADYFFPRNIRLMSLDWETIFDQERVRKVCRDAGTNRKLTPIVWAHHDDRTYIGPPYKPFDNFASLLKDTRSLGFGIIHWTTRPLDLYFKSLAEQVWQSSADRPLRATLEDMAARSFGENARGPGADYLMTWVTEGRQFGRETTDRFIDVPLTDAQQVITRAEQRLAMVSALGGRAAYYRDYERFTIEFFRNHSLLEQSQALRKKGDIEAARKVFSGAQPEEAIRRYVQAISHPPVNRGELALVISLNLRWLPYFVAEREALGLQPVRIKFQPTQHEALAQGAGRNTFYFDREGRLWKALGEKETGAAAFTDPSHPEELCRSYVRADKPLTLPPGQPRFITRHSHSELCAVEITPAQ